MSSQNIKTAIELGIITIDQASTLLKEEIKQHESTTTLTTIANLSTRHSSR